MANPILGSVFKPTDFDLYLDEIGYADITGKDRVELVDRFISAVEYAIVTEIFRTIPLDKQAEWTALMQDADKSGDETPVNQFLEREIPEIETLVDEAIEKVKNEFRMSTGTLAYTIEQQLAMLGRGEGKTAEEYRTEDLGIPNPADLEVAELPNEEADIDQIRNQISTLDSTNEPDSSPTSSDTNPVTDELNVAENNPSIG